MLNWPSSNCAYLNQALHLSAGTADKKKGTEHGKTSGLPDHCTAGNQRKKNRSNRRCPDPSKEPIPVSEPESGPKLIIEEPKTASP